MDELYAREAAVPQASMWAPGAAPAGISGYRKGRYDIMIQKEAKRVSEALPFRGLPQGTDPPFFHGSRWGGFLSGPIIITFHAGGCETYGL